MKKTLEMFSVVLITIALALFMFAMIGVSAGLGDKQLPLMPWAIIFALCALVTIITASKLRIN